MNFYKKIACGLLAAVMILTAGCAGGSDLTWAYRSGDIQPPVGVYILYLVNAASNAEGKVSEQRGEEASAEALSYKEVLGETLEDQPASQWIQAEAQKKMREYLAVERKFAEKGLAITEPDRMTARNTAATTWESYGDFYEKNGVAKSSMELQVENALKRDALFYNLYGEGGEFEVPAEELKNIFAGDYAKVEYMLFYKSSGDTTDDDGKTKTADEKNAEVKKEAEAYLARLRAGEELLELIYEQEKAEAGEDAGNVVKPGPGEREMVISEDMKGTYYSSELVDGAMAIAAGSAGIVEDEYFFYLLNRKDILEDPDDFGAYREKVLQGFKSGEYDEKVSQWAGEVEIEHNQAAIDKYTAARLTIDDLLQ